MSAVQSIQTSMMKMWKTVDDLDLKVQSSISTSSSPSQQCHCGRISSDLTSLAQEVKDINDWKQSMTPVLTEILNKTRISVYSQTKLSEDLDSQKHQMGAQSRDIKVVKTKVSNMQRQVQVPSEVLKKSEILTKFQEVQDLIKQGTSGGGNLGTSAAPIPQSE